MWDSYIWVQNLKLALSLLSYLSVLVAMISLIFTVRGYRANSKNRQVDIEMRKIEFDIKVLDHFSESVIPKISDFEKKEETEFDKEGYKTAGEEKQLEMKFSIDLQLEIYNIFNKLEKDCVYITSGITHEDILYDIIGDVFCGFMTRHVESFKRIKSERAPYNNVTSVMNRWGVEKNIQHLGKRRDDELKEIDKEIKKYEKIRATPFKKIDE